MATIYIMGERPDKYDEKLAIKGTFADVFKVVKKNKEQKNGLIIPPNK